jgi:hypothetical protein
MTLSIHFKIAVMSHKQRKKDYIIDYDKRNIFSWSSYIALHVMNIVNQIIENFDDVSFRELFVRIRVLFFSHFYKIRSALSYLY